VRNIAALLACVICPCLIVGAFGLDGLGISGRIVGTILVALGFWVPELLVGRAVACSPPVGGTLATPDAMKAEPALGSSGPWWRRRYVLKPHQTVLISGLGGALIGCMMLL
jgi:hypothetical protein